MRRYGEAVSLAIVFIVLIIFPLASVKPYAEGTIYSAGDWLKYRIYTKAEFMNMTFECDFTIRVNVEKIDGSNVTLSSTVESVEKGDGMCSAMMSSFNSRSTVDVKQLDPRGGAIIIDPTYTGEYDINGIKVTYNKGVLTKLVGRSISMGIDFSIVIELIDTSIAELKGISILSIVLAISIILAVIVIAIVTTIVMLKRIRKTAITTPTTPPT